ncbi:hypothetical protein GCM10009753_47790 [Streptantibioticus ferralitis]
MHPDGGGGDGGQAKAVAKGTAAVAKEAAVPVRPAVVAGPAAVAEAASVEAGEQVLSPAQLSVRRWHLGAMG